MASLAASASAAPLEDEDLLSLILLRLPPLPSSLCRASLVCKRWRRLVRDPGFRRLLRAFHRTPPVLGFFHNSPQLPRYFAAEGSAGIHIAAAARDLRRDGQDGMWWFVDCRHGRVLLRARDWCHLLVWNPITDDRREISVRDQVRENAYDCNAALLCPSAATGGDCHSVPFDVVFVFTGERRVFASVYSSLTGAWGAQVSMLTPSLQCEFTEEQEPCALFGDALFWLLGESSILEFQLGDQRLALVERPPETFSVYKRNIRVVRSEGGGLGLTAGKNFGLHLWAREFDYRGTAKWVLHRAINLRTLLDLPLIQPRVGWIPVWISGLGEDGNVVILRSAVGMFMVWPETMQCKMVTTNTLMRTVYPYASFYFPKEVHTGL